MNLSQDSHSVAEECTPLLVLLSRYHPGPGTFRTPGETPAVEGPGEQVVRETCPQGKHG